MSLPFENFLQEGSQGIAVIKKMGRISRTPEQHREYFLSKCQINENGCWIFTGADKSRGYKEYKAQKKRYLAHRYSYIIHKGEIPKGLFILHTCDNPACVNPEHLEAGTQSKNIKDMFIRKRRNVKADNSPRHKITSIIAKKIKELYSFENYTQSNLGKMFNLDQSSISHIVNYRNWNE